jgi:hypothetical protein
VSDFFEPPPPPPEPEREYHPPPWLAPPANVLGSAVPLQLMLARTESVVVAVLGATAYPTGVELTVSVRRRGKGRTALEEPPFGLHRPLRGQIPDEVLRFGVQFADGRKATSLGAFRRPPEEAPAHPVLTPHGGGGGGGQWNFSFWLYPLPPAGPLAFVCEWPSEGIELTRHEIDAELIRESAGRAKVLWEQEPGASGRSTHAVSQTTTATDHA